MCWLDGLGYGHGHTEGKGKGCKGYKESVANAPYAPHFCTLPNSIYLIYIHVISQFYQINISISIPTPCQVRPRSPSRWLPLHLRRFGVSPRVQVQLLLCARAAMILLIPNWQYLTVQLLWNKSLRPKRRNQPPRNQPPRKDSTRVANWQAESQANN